MKRIPRTSLQNYLSGPASLNIPSPDGTGDWHMLGTFDARNSKPLQFFADASFVHILGHAGIEDRSSDAARAGLAHEGPLWCASHSRAIADMVLRSFLRGGAATHVRMDDWIAEEQNRIVFAILGNANIGDEIKTGLEKWIRNKA